jgi:hypothetical protein
VKSFLILSSLDGKIWKTSEEFQGLSSGNETKEIILPEPVSARYLRVQPIQSEGHPALRMDVMARNIMPASTQLVWFQPVESPEELSKTLSQIPEKLAELKGSFKDCLGFW